MPPLRGASSFCVDTPLAKEPKRKFNGPWVAMKASSALWLQPAPCGGRELQRRVCLLAELYRASYCAHGVACCTP